MKIWLNNLKEGSEFYYIFLNDVYKCKHLGDAHNMNFRMSRIKFKILDLEDEELINLYGLEHEAFVNQYVYDNKEEAINEFINELNRKIQSNKIDIELENIKINNLESNIRLLENKIKKYDNQNIK